MSNDSSDRSVEPGAEATLGYLMVERYPNSTLMDVVDDDGDGSTIRPMSSPPAASEVPAGWLVVALVEQS